jgi:peptidyl-prolyl cis-trans isomerase A (cyclophilin A)
MARGKPGSASGDFFIIIGTMPSLDADPKVAGDNLGYAAFGRVADGMETVRRIFDAPISPTLGVKEGMKGQMIAAPIRILTARRGKAGAVVPLPAPTPAPAPKL